MQNGIFSDFKAPFSVIFKKVNKQLMLTSIKLLECNQNLYMYRTKFFYICISSLKMNSHSKGIAHHDKINQRHFKKNENATKWIWYSSVLVICLISCVIYISNNIKRYFHFLWNDAKYILFLKSFLWCIISCNCIKYLVKSSFLNIRFENIILHFCMWF